MRNFYRKDRFVLYEIFTNDDNLFSYYLSKVNHGNLYYLYGTPTRTREYAIDNIDKWISLVNKEFWNM